MVCIGTSMGLPIGPFNAPGGLKYCPPPSPPLQPFILTPVGIFSGQFFHFLAWFVLRYFLQVNWE